MDPDLSPSVTKELVLSLTAVLAVVWSTLRFIFEPRFHNVIDLKATAIAEAKMAPIVKSIAKLQEQLDAVEQDGQERSRAVDRMSIAVDKSAGLLERVVVRLEQQGQSLAYIEGTMRGRPPRTKVEHVDDDHGF